MLVLGAYEGRQPHAGRAFRPTVSLTRSTDAAQVTFLCASGRGDAGDLCVDDDAMLVTLIERVLANLGYRVAGYGDPRGALAAFRTRPDAFDAVVTDLSMPCMVGAGPGARVANLMDSSVRLSGATSGWGACLAGSLVDCDA